MRWGRAAVQALLCKTCSDKFETDKFEIFLEKHQLYTKFFLETNWKIHQSLKIK